MLPLSKPCHCMAGILLRQYGSDSEYMIFNYITEGTYLPFTLAIVLKFLYDNRTSENLQREELRIMQYNEYSA